MEWSYDQLWLKAKLFSTRSHEQDPSDPLFALWAILCLEMLGRASLAHVHPALLADPSEGENILYAFNYSTTKSPKSVAAKTVFERCRKIIDDFTDREYDHCLNLMERRNRELHSGAAAFEDFPTKVWLSEYYRVIKILLVHQEKEMGDLLGDEDAVMAEEMIATDHRKVQEGVTQIIRMSKDEFFRKGEKERDNLRGQAGEQAFKVIPGLGARVKCPACNSWAIISGKTTKTSEPYFDADEYICRRIVLVPTHLKCVACGLILDGYGKLQAANVGGQIPQIEQYDPMAYYDFEATVYAEYDSGDEYGND